MILLMLLLFSHSEMSHCLWPHAHQASSPVLHYLPEFAQAHVHWVGDAIQPSHSVIPFSSCSPSIRVFSNESTLHIRWPKYWNFSFIISPSNEYSELTSFRIDFFDLLVDSQESSPAPQFNCINSFVLNLLSGPTLTSILDYWKNHSFAGPLLVKVFALSLLFNMLSRFVIDSLSRSKCLYDLFIFLLRFCF